VNSSLLYRIASVLILFFAIGHTVGFLQTDPQWGVESLVASMRSIHFQVQGFRRSYWDFFVGFGFFVSVFLVFAAIVAWQLGRLPAEMHSRVRGVAWALALCFAVLTILSVRYFFAIPLVLSVLITVCLLAAAWRAE
jgi:hypothetical protein